MRRGKPTDSDIAIFDRMIDYAKSTKNVQSLDDIRRVIAEERVPDTKEFWNGALLLLGLVIFVSLFICASIFLDKGTIPEVFVAGVTVPLGALAGLFAATK